MKGTKLVSHISVFIKYNIKTLSKSQLDFYK